MFRAARFRDVHLYGVYTDALLHGRVPYRDFFVEYPPGAFAVFVPSAAAGIGHYNATFKTLMALCGAATLALVLALLVRVGATVARVWAAGLLLALAPAALGPISLNTYDAWPALLTVAAVAALVCGRDVAGFALLGLAFSAKVYPVVLLPVALVWTWRARGRSTALAAFAALAALAALIILPFAVVAPHGLFESFRSQATRGLQIESLGAQLLVAAHHVGGVAVGVVHRTHDAVTYDLRGRGAAVVTALSSILELLALALVTWRFARRAPTNARAVAACAAAVAGFLAFTRVFSPQYLVWIVPLVALAGGALAWTLLGSALVLDQVWFFHYGSITSLGSRSWVVLARDVLVVVLFAVLLRAMEDEDPVALEHELPRRIRA